MGRMGENSERLGAAWKKTFCVTPKNHKSVGSQEQIIRNARRSPNPNMPTHFDPPQQLYGPEVAKQGGNQALCKMFSNYGERSVGWIWS